MIPVIELRSPYNYDTEAVSLETGLHFGDEVSLAQQQFKDDADINNILDRWTRTGELPVSARLPDFGDFTGPSDYQEALRLVHDADSMFSDLDAKVRARFHNNPAEFLDFMTDPRNVDEAISLGLAKRVAEHVDVPVDSPVDIPPKE